MTAASTISVLNGPTNPFTGIQATDLQAANDARNLSDAITAALFQAMDRGRLLRFSAIGGSDAAGYTYDPTPRSIDVDRIRELRFVTSAGGQKWVLATADDGLTYSLASPVVSEQTAGGAAAYWSRILSSVGGIFAPKSRWVRAVLLSGTVGAWAVGSQVRLLNLGLAGFVNVNHSSDGQYWLGIAWADGTTLTVVSDDPTKQGGSAPNAWATAIVANLDPTS